MVSGCTRRSIETMNSPLAPNLDLGSDGSTQIQLSIMAIQPYSNIDVSLPAAGHVYLEIQNVVGYHVRTLFDGETSAGTMQLYWDYKNDEGDVVKDGFYNAHVRAGGLEASKMLVIRGME